MKKHYNTSWKRIAAGALSMALVAGAMPVNVGGFLTGGKGIVAHAAEHTYAELQDLLGEAGSWFETNGGDLEVADGDAYSALSTALYNAAYVDSTNENAVDAAYDNLYAAYTAAKAALNDEPEQEEAEPFFENFNNGIPETWTNSDTYPWSTSGSHSDRVAANDGGFAYCYDAYNHNYDLMSPRFTLSGQESAQLSFLYANKDWSGDTDELTVFYRVGDGDWVQIFATGTNAHGSWTQAEVDLPEGALTENVQLLFRGTMHYGHGIWLDDISIPNARIYVAQQQEEQEEQEVNFYAETDDSIWNGCWINLYAEDEQSFETTITVKGDAPFTRAEALEWLGIDDEGLEVVQYDEENPDNAFTVATISVDGNEEAADEDEDGTYELDLTFTAIPYQEADGDDTIFFPGSGTVVIGDMYINVAVAERQAESDDGELPVNGLTKLSLTYEEDGETRTQTYSKSALSRIHGSISIPAGASVTMTASRKSWVNYNDGFDVELEDLTETKNSDGTYTYKFTMPGYDVNHDFIWSGLNFFGFDQLDPENEDDAALIAALAQYGTENDAYNVKAANMWSAAVAQGAATAYDIVDEWNKGYYADKAITATTPFRLNIGYWNENNEFVPLDKDMTIGEITVNDVPVTTYTYTFKMPSTWIDVSPYYHEHDYKFKVEDNKLIRTCTNADFACDEDNAPVVVAELNNQMYNFGTEEQPDWRWSSSMNSYIYDGVERPAGLFVDGYMYEDEIAYYNADAFGDPVGEEIDGAPVNAGKYVAVDTFWLDLNYNEAFDDGEQFELTLPYKIAPKDINDIDEFEVDTIAEWNGSFAAPEGYLIDNDNYLEGSVNGDYVITGTFMATEPGTYTMTISGVGNYTGSREVTWTYGDEDMTELTAEMITIDTIYANGYAQANVKVNGNMDMYDSYYVFGDMFVDAGGTYKLTVVGDPSNGLSGSVDVDWVVDEFAVSGRYADVKSVAYADSKLSFRSNMSVPEGAAMTKVGIIATNNPDKKYALTLDTEAVAGETFVKEYTKGLEGKTVFPYTWTKSSVQDDAVWYAVPYVCYTDNDGNNVIVYGDLVEAAVENGKAALADVELGQAKLKDYSYDVASKKLSFNNSMVVPEGCTMTAVGICATNNEAKAAELSLDTAAAANETYIKSYTNGIAGKTVTSYTWTKSGVNVNDTWYVKSYVTYTDADGISYTAYGALETVTAGAVVVAPQIEMS